MSIKAITSEEIRKKDLSSLEKIAAFTPEFTVGRAASGSGATLVLRGIGSDSTSIGLEQSVAVVVDGVYYGQGRTIDEGFFDLGRVEILKGPQALFYGKNATAGVISITTADPTDHPDYTFRLSGEFPSNNLVGEFIGSQPLTDTLGVRLALRAGDMFGGYFSNNAAPLNYTTTDHATGLTTNNLSPPGAHETPQTKEFMGRFTLKWRPTPQLTATLKVGGDINNTNNPAWNYVFFNCPGGTYQFNPAITCGKNFTIYQNAFPAAIAATEPYANKDGALGNQYYSYTITGSVNYEMKDVTLTSVTNYNYNRNTFELDSSAGSPTLSAAGGYATERTPYDSFSTEERALTKFDFPINFMLGVYYQNSKRNYNEYNASGGLSNSAAPFAYDEYVTNSKYSRTKGDTYAGFAQMIWKVVPQVELTGGVRYTYETKDSFFIQPYSNPVRVLQGVFVPGVLITADQIFHNASPEATLTYRPTSNITLYAAYKTGYKSGGFSNSGIYSSKTTVEHDFAFNPETAHGEEGGIKSTLFDRQLLLNLGVYSYTYDNLQVDFFNAPVFAFSTINAGAARSDGVEMQMAYAPLAIRGLTFQGSLNYNDSHYTNFGDAPCYTGETPSQGCYTVIPRPAQDLSGVPTAMAPKWTAALGSDYTGTLNAKLGFGLSMNVRYSDTYLGSPFGSPLSRQSAYFDVDAAARIFSSDHRWELAVIGKNLGNQFYFTGAQDAPSTGSGTGTVAGHQSDQIGFAALPRTVQVQLTYHY